MRKKILDLLGEYHKKECQDEVNRRYDKFQKTPSAYPRLQRLQKKLKNLPDDLRYLDPLFLPSNSHVFRGIGCRKGKERARDALVDLFTIGIGPSELTRASPTKGTWAKSGQLFFSADAWYALNFVDEEGALIVLDGSYINQVILRRRARQETEDGLHCVLYDTVSHEHIKAVYVAKDLKEEILLLHDANIDNPPTNLKYFSYLAKEELMHLIQALKHDPYQICSKLKEADLSEKSSFIPDEPEASYEDIDNENLKREIVRELMEEKYATEFGSSKKKFRSKL